MYTQQQCLVSPHHFVHLGVCYEGTNANITLSDPNHPTDPHWHVTGVPEPGALWLMCPALALGYLLSRPRSPRSGDLSESLPKGGV